MKIFSAAILLLASTTAFAAPPPAYRHVKPHQPRAEGAAESKTDTAAQPAKEFFHPSEVRSTGTVIVVLSG